MDTIDIAAAIMTAIERGDIQCVGLRKLDGDVPDAVTNTSAAATTQRSGRSSKA